MIKLKDVKKIYNLGKPGQVLALDGVSLTIEKGEMVSIMGRSGSGKSTLLHIIGCLDGMTGGQYLLEGADVTGYSDAKLSRLRNNRLGVVLQDFALIHGETALKNVMTPLYFCKGSLARMKAKACEALAAVGISELMNKKVSEMSGGQKQRVAIARAIVNNPAVILADEPTGALDSRTSDEIMSLMKELNKRGATVITVTHDPKVSEYADRIITLSDGKVTGDAKTALTES